MFRAGLLAFRWSRFVTLKDGSTDLMLQQQPGDRAAHSDCSRTQTCACDAKAQQCQFSSDAAEPSLNGVSLGGQAGLEGFGVGAFRLRLRLLLLGRVAARCTPGA